MTSLLVLIPLEIKEKSVCRCTQLQEGFELISLGKSRTCVGSIGSPIKDPEKKWTNRYGYVHGMFEHYYDQEQEPTWGIPALTNIHAGVESLGSVTRNQRKEPSETLDPTSQLKQRNTPTREMSSRELIPSTPTSELCRTTSPNLSTPSYVTSGGATWTSVLWTVKPTAYGRASEGW